MKLAPAIGSLALAFVAMTSAAHADDSIWARAKDPEIGAREAAHRRAVFLLVDSELAGSTADPRSAGTALSSLYGARDVLERAGAASSPDVRLRFDYGRILSRLHQCPRAIEVLTAALAIAPHAIGAADAWFEIGICDAFAEDHVAEERAYLAALDLEDDPYSRAVMLGNLAESRMARGDLDGASDAAEASLALRPDNVLVDWTLAVVRDRRGDEYGGILAASTAISLDPKFDSLEDPDVFFQPAYEVHWYRGMGELAWAERDKGSEEGKLHTMAALRDFAEFVRLAPATDRWRARAEAHVKSLETRLGLTPKK